MFKILLLTATATSLLLGAGLTNSATGRVGATAPPREIDSPKIAGAPSVEMIGLDSEFEALASWAVGLFDAADLELPLLRFVHHGTDRAECSGRDGSHRREGEVSVINLCTTETDRFVKVMLLHETAHAWAGQSLSEGARNEFQALRGWVHWRDYSAAPWHENGTEQAAEIIMWGLIDTPIRMIRIYQASCDDLEAGYQALTGAAPLNGLRDYC